MVRHLQWFAALQRPQRWMYVCSVLYWDWGRATPHRRLLQTVQGRRKRFRNSLLHLRSVVGSSTEPL